MIWLCSRPAHAADMLEDIECWQAHLPFERLQKMCSYRRLSDQWLCAAAYRLLQHGLFSEHGIVENCVQTDVAASGKPFLKGVQEIGFNISHCDMGAICALSRHEIGVDIEAFSHPSHQVMRRVLNDEEYESVISSSCPEKSFTRLWTLKESWLKATGLGLSYGARRLNVSFSEDRPHIVRNGFVAQIAWENEKGCIAQCSGEKSILPVICVNSQSLHSGEKRSF